MKKVDATINGIHIIVNIPETLHEFKEGARLSEGTLLDNEGYYFQFGKRERLRFENSGVQQDLKVLFLSDPIGNSSVVQEDKYMHRMSGTHVVSDYVYENALELRADFCQVNDIGKGAILQLNLEEVNSGREDQD